MPISNGTYRVQTTKNQIILELLADNKNMVSLYLDLDEADNIVNVEGYKIEDYKAEIDGPIGTVESLRWLTSTTKQAGVQTHLDNVD